MEIMGQISAFFFGLNKKELAGILSNSKEIGTLQGDLERQNAYYSAMLQVAGNENSNATLDLYTRIVLVLIIILIAVNLI